uniref:Carboxylesterase type B domain-containing protein n=2 Tax=Scylla olivacea TaxID=85551 RepID=A0A0P4VZ69_SCYOL
MVVAVLVVLVVVIVALASTSRHAFPQDPRIQPPYVTTVTTCGLVQGMVDGGAFVFRGVPYAVPPVGERRFRRSQPHSKLEDCWTGTYMANVTRPCWGYDSQGGVVQGFEDCLLLDVFTPQLGYDTPLPVVVVVGGASLGGDAQRPWMVSKAAQLVQDRRVVLVSPQLRRGPFGFFPHPAVAASTYPHTAGNQGASDLLAALIWTRHNVEHFGGDPAQVTLLGHRAGAALAWPLLSSRSGRDLVHSAWLSGAAPHHPTRSWRDADPALLESLNCTSVACLEAMPALQVMEAPPLEWRRPGHHAWLVADGLDVSFLPAMPQVPLVLGESTCSLPHTSHPHLTPTHHTSTHTHHTPTTHHISTSHTTHHTPPPHTCPSTPCILPSISVTVVMFESGISLLCHAVSLTSHNSFSLRIHRASGCRAPAILEGPTGDLPLSPAGRNTGRPQVFFHSSGTADHSAAQQGGHSDRVREPRVAAPTDKTQGGGGAGGCGRGCSSRGGTGEVL